MADRPIVDAGRQRLLGIAAAIACISIVGMGLGLSIPLTSFIMDLRGAPASVIGANIAVAAIANIAVAPLVPAFIRRFGVTPVLLAAVLVAAVSLVAFYLAGAIWLWFPIRFVFGAAIGTLFVVSEFWINAVAGDGRRGFIMGVYGTVLSVGFAAGPAILALTGFEGFLPFAVGACLMLAAIGPILAGGDGAPRIEGGEQGSSVLIFLLAAPAATLAAFVFGAVESSAMSLMPIYGLRTGLGETQAALMIALFALGNVALQIPLGILADRTDRRRLLLACAAIGGVGIALLPLATGSFLLLAAILLVSGGAMAGLYTVGLTHLGARFTGAALAQANAAFVMLYSFGMLVGPVAVGGAFDLYDPHGFPLALAAFVAFYIVVVMARMRRGQGPVS